MNPNNPLPQGQTKRLVVRKMFDAIAPRYDLLNRLLTFGLDRRWRRQAVQALHLPQKTLVLDLACGTGDFCQDIEAAGLVAIGMDFSAGMLQGAQKRQTANKLQASLVLADALCLPLPDQSTAGITCGFALRNVVALDQLFAEVARVLRPSGRLSLLDVSEPTNSLLRGGHQIYFGRVVPKIGGLLSDRAAYKYLPESLAYLPPTSDLLQLLRTHGFVEVAHTQLSGGITQLITATRTPL